MILYRIRRKTDGLFSNNSLPPTFSETGYIWEQKSDLIQYLTSLFSSKHSNEYDDCYVVEYLLAPSFVQDVKKFYRESNKHKNEKTRN